MKLGGSPRKTLTALSLGVNWSTEIFLHPERNPAGSRQYFPIALTFKYNFHCHYLQNDIKCARRPQNSSNPAHLCVVSEQIKSSPVGIVRADRSSLAQPLNSDIQKRLSTIYCLKNSEFGNGCCMPSARVAR